MLGLGFFKSGIVSLVSAEDFKCPVRLSAKCLSSNNDKCTRNVPWKVLPSHLRYISSGDSEKFKKISMNEKVTQKTILVTFTTLHGPS